MDRGVVVGGVLVCASFLLALLLNRSAELPTRSAPASAPVKLDVHCSEEHARAGADEHLQGDPAENAAVSSEADSPSCD